MTPRERAACNAGVEAVRQMTPITAMTLPLLSGSELNSGLPSGAYSRSAGTRSLSFNSS